MNIVNKSKKMKEEKRKIKLCREDKIYYAVSEIALTIFLIIVTYPIIYIISSSFSSGTAVSTGKVILWPVEFCLDGYKAVMQNRDIITGYLNTIFYTVVGTFFNVVMTLIVAYPLSRKDLPGKNFFAFLFSFTMMFSGGIIPSYLLMKDLNILNTRWAMILPGAISVYNMLVVKSFMQSSIPVELLEAAKIDGCSDWKYFYKIVLPLSTATIAVITLFYAVAHWNSYFNALMYLDDRNLVPLQIVLREILINNMMDAEMVVDPELLQAKQGMSDLLKYSLIVVSSLPIIAIYPFVQKHFVKGVMVGSVKG